VWLPRVEAVAFVCQNMRANLCNGCALAQTLAEILRTVFGKQNYKWMAGLGSNNLSSTRDFDSLNFLNLISVIELRLVILHVNFKIN
jgi:hypothetical protein